MLRLMTAAAFSASLTVSAAAAQTTQDDKIDALFEALGMIEMTEIMAEEGVAYGAQIAADMLPDGATPTWEAAIAAIYDPEVMRTELRDTLGTELAKADVDAMLNFFASARGEGIIELELSARRALLDEEVEEASKEFAAIAMADETPLYVLVDEFVETNDLVESNVVGALNSSYAFYLGLIDGGAMPAGVTPETALQDVWSQEDDIRTNTTEWVYGFLMLAYQPLPQDDLEAYIAFFASDAGDAMNAALFTAFNGMFNDISRALGLAASQAMISQEL
ncbi:MAG: hypothetical protein AAFU41_15385 [Pseudomonadota bacterium]